MDKGDLAIDPRGLIFETYRMDGIRIEECRSVFLDWALGQAIGVDMNAALLELKGEYVATNPGHPMNEVIEEGLTRSAGPTGRKGGHSARTA
ncbi:MAG: hypothetical protein ACI861_002317 [Paracoccaceae bacterium]|jgi:hypothetical protein